MANFSSLKQAIQNYIKENGNKEITGNLLQEILLSMVVTMGDNAINSLTTVVNELNTILHSVDAEPTKNSVNLVRSGGVWSGINREALRAFNAETFEARFNSTNNRVEFFNQSGDMLYWYDASAFVTTGLVEDVYIENDNLVFVINTSAGEKTIEVPLEDVFNPNNYYTKTQIDDIVRTIRELYDGAEYRGFITPSSQAESKQGVKMVCFATEAGTYTNFLANYDTPIVIPVRGIWVFERGVDADDWTAYSLLEIDKVYAPAQASGMGRVVLQKNMVNGVNTLTQDMFYKGEVGSRVPNTNTIFVIQYDYTLGENITIPANCVLEFDGGSISGAYTITGQNTGIEAGLIKIFNTNITLSGTWNISETYPEWFGGIGKEKNTFDSTLAIQKCIDWCQSLKGLVVFSGTAYNLTSITIKREIQGLRGRRNTALYALDSDEEAMIKINEGVVINYGYDLVVENLRLVPLVNQTGMYFHAIAENAVSGAWHWELKNIAITARGSGKCMHFRANDSESGGYDAANQYIHFENVNLYKDNSNVDSRCIVFQGQCGQFTMLNCEFNGQGEKLPNGDNISDYIIEYIQGGANDNSKMPQNYINVTFQTSNNGIYTSGAHLVCIGCHFEDISYANIRTNGVLSLFGNNIAMKSSSSYPIRVLPGANVYGRGNTVSNKKGNVLKYEGTQHGSVDFDVCNLIYENHFGEKVEKSGSTIRNGNSTAKVIFLDNDSTGDVGRLEIPTPIGETVTLLNLRDSNFMLYTKDGSGSSNVIYPGHKWMKVEPGDTVTLIRQDSDYFRYISSSKIYPLTNADYLSGIRIGENLYNDEKKHPTWWNGSDWIDGSGSTDNERENGYSLSLTSGALISNSVIGKLFYIEEGTGDVLGLNMAVPIGTEFTIVNKRATYFMLYTKDGSDSSNVIYPGHRWLRVEPGDTVTLIRQDSDYFRYISSSKIYPLTNADYLSGVRIGENLYNDEKKHPTWWNGSDWIDGSGSTDNERENGYSLSLTSGALISNSVIGKLFYIEEGTGDVARLAMAVPIGTEFTIVNKRASAHFMLYSKDGSASSNVLIPGSKWIKVDVGECITLVKEDTDLYRYIRSSRNPILDNPSYITGARVGDISFDNTNKKPVWFNGTNWVYADGTTV